MRPLSSSIHKDYTNQMKTARTMGVYGITLLLDGRVYSGSSVECEARLRHHRNDLRRGIHPNPYLQAAWNKYGENNFLFEVVEKVQDKIWLRAREQAWINRTQKSSFNLSMCAWTPADDRNPEVLAKITASNKERFLDPEKREIHSVLMQEVMNRSDIKEAVSKAQNARFSDPVKKSAFLDIMNSELARQNKSTAAKEWMNDPTRNAGLLAALGSEEMRAQRSISSKRYHSDPDNGESRQLRALHISQSKKGKGNPGFTKICPFCMTSFEVEYKNRDQVCCSKGCATKLRYDVKGREMQSQRMLLRFSDPEECLKLSKSQKARRVRERRTANVTS